MGQGSCQVHCWWHPEFLFSFLLYDILYIRLTILYCLAVVIKYLIGLEKEQSAFSLVERMHSSGPCAISLGYVIKLNMKKIAASFGIMRAEHRGERQY